MGPNVWEIEGLTVTGGVERLVPRLGGAGIMVWDRGKLTLERCRVEDNLAAEGGGIAFERTIRGVRETAAIDMALIDSADARRLVSRAGRLRDGQQLQGRRDDARLQRHVVEQRLRRLFRRRPQPHEQRR